MVIPQEINDAIVENKLVIFVGSGVSVGAGLPDWKNLVKSILVEKSDYIPKSEKFIDALDAEIMTPLEVLDKIQNNKKYVYQGIESQIGQPYESEIHKLFGKVSNKIVTTNYDQLLEHNNDIKEVIHRKSQYDLAKLGTAQSFIFKLHGCTSQMESCVIFSDDYDEIYNEDTLAKFQFSKLLSDNVCLFLGFSFSDDDISNLVEQLFSLYDGFGNRHFVLSTTQVNLSGLNTILINNYDEIRSFMDLLSVNEESETLDDCSLEYDEECIVLNQGGIDKVPHVDYWVGRDTELGILRADFKVAFISGIGGQGKSALASHYINLCINEDQKVDWRDFKEEEHNFQAKLISMIEGVSLQKIESENLVGLTADQLIDVYFDQLGSQETVVVFDNVDRYIDVENFMPFGSVGNFFREAMKRDHHSKFIFTCRPSIKYAATQFAQITLEGLAETDVLELLRSYNVSIKSDSIDDIANRAHRLTKGHALWINVILAQARRGEREVEDFLLRMEKKKLDGDETSLNLSNEILGAIWETLNNPQRLVLRTLAESVSPEAEDELGQILEPELTYNKLSRSLKTLTNLNLIVFKGDEKYIELHPLVKELIRQKFPSGEQQHFVSLLIEYYNRFIVVLKKKQGKNLGFSDFQTWAKKIELHINNGEMQNALNALIEINDTIRACGYIEEYVRLNLLFLNALKWNKKTIETLLSFDKAFHNAIVTLVEYGASAEAEEFLFNFERLVDVKNDRHLLLLSLKTHKLWFEGKYEDAIKFGEEASYFLEKSQLEDKHQARYNFHLALRDSKDKKHLQRALQYFCNGEDLLTFSQSSLIKPELGGAGYGNVGRCLGFQGEPELAINCIAKSYKILESSFSDCLINQGYAAFWLYELLYNADKRESSVFFLVRANNCWKNSSPPLSNQLNADFSKPFADNKQTVLSLEGWQIDKFCTEWIDKRISGLGSNDAQ